MICVKAPSAGAACASGASVGPPQARQAARVYGAAPGAIRRGASQRSSDQRPGPHSTMWLRSTDAADRLRTERLRRDVLNIEILQRRMRMPDLVEPGDVGRQGAAGRFGASRRCSSI